MSERYFVYVLYSISHRRFYFGSSENPLKRLKSHNDPRNKGWTKRYAPWKLIYTEEFMNKRDALIKERWLKTGTGRDFVKLLPPN
ncbi:MAG: GIY-YIG nuclease family protein [Bacteroidales bacterium]